VKKEQITVLPFLFTN